MTNRSIERFHGEYRFLSNFWPARVKLDGVEYPTVEHAYVAAKTLDPAVRRQVLACATPGDAKRAGRTITLRADWAEVKLQVMASLVRQKFEHPDMRLMLVATGDADLVEGNTWGDTFWGRCRGVGENHLGRLLMEERRRARQITEKRRD